MYSLKSMYSVYLTVLADRPAQGPWTDSLMAQTSPNFQTHFILVQARGNLLEACQVINKY